MSLTKNIIEERIDKALDVADKVEWDVYPVESDDYGDTEWKWHVIFHITINDTWYELYDDYYRKLPDDVVIYNNMLESIKEGSMGERIADVLAQEESKGEKKYQIRYIVQESTDGVEWHEVADCMSEEEALEEIKEKKGE